LLNHHAAPGYPIYFKIEKTKLMQTKSFSLFCVIFFIYTLGLHAQDTELIVNGDFSDGNSGFTSDYIYCNSSNCLFPEGYYAVGANPTFFHSNFFGKDHTTGTGNLMIVNGKVEPKKSVWCETISVSPGTSYKFSYWLSSVVTAYPAILQLKINGVEIGGKFTAPTSLYAWKQFSTIWNSGADTSAYICFFDVNTIAGGNDFGLDDISFKSVGSQANIQDSLVLVDLYNNTDGPNWYNHSGWLTGPVKNWYGIILYGDRVSQINLDSNNLNGHLPSSLGNLENLNVLNLKSNELRGDIPSRLGKLTNLQNLTLTSNHLKGNIPSSFSKLKNLRRLRLRDNHLSGTVPAFLGTLPKLNKLVILHNNYTFDGLETLVQNNKLDSFKYDRQRAIDIHQNDNVLSVYAGGTLSNNTYNWFNDGVWVSTITGDSTFTPTTSGNYNVEVTNSIVTELTLRSDTVSINALATVAKNNSDAVKANDRNNFSVYPNPVRDILHLDNLKSKATISILTQDGHVVDKRIVSNSTHEWNVKNLAAGTYYMKIEEDTKITILKFIKQ